MPHEIIMPALGMAQDSGVLVQWLKAPGDAVAPGDALFEVETDKATMEVEAQAAGWLADVRARAGEAVPVGNVIAVIAEKPGSDGETPAVATDAPDDRPPTETPPSPGIPEGHHVIMPALGMAQDTGLIVGWLKVPGDAVAEDETLLEVETDKSTMEVPAGTAGFVAALLAEAGQDVPVGEVIAVITAEKPEKPMRTAARPSPAASPQPVAREVTDETDRPAPQAVPHVAAPSSSRNGQARTPMTPKSGRIFASPKARRLAAEAGLDLARLVAAGYPQPYHAADVETLRTLAPESAPPVVPAMAPAAARQITARAATAPAYALLAWLKTDAGLDLSPAALWLRFAAAALRSARPTAGDLVIEVAPIGAEPTRLRNPDRAGLTAEAEAIEDAPDLILRDLSASAITGLSLGAASAPTLSLVADGDGLLIALDFNTAQLDDAAAIALVAGFADRLDDPLTQLL